MNWGIIERPQSSMLPRDKVLTLRCASTTSHKGAKAVDSTGFNTTLLECMHPGSQFYMFNTDFFLLYFACRFLAFWGLSLLGSFSNCWTVDLYYFSFLFLKLYSNLLFFWLTLDIAIFFFPPPDLFFLTGMHRLITCCFLPNLVTSLDANCFHRNQTLEVAHDSSCNDFQQSPCSIPTNSFNAKLDTSTA